MQLVGLVHGDQEKVRRREGEKESRREERRTGRRRNTCRAASRMTGQIIVC